MIRNTAEQVTKRVTDPLDAAQFFQRGDSFLLVSRVRPVDHWLVAEMGMALTVCTAFATEAFLKVLRMIESGGMPIQTHDIKALFLDLSPPARNRIRRNWMNDWHAPQQALAGLPELAAQSIPKSFEACLSASAHSFIKWRYDTGGATLVWALSGVAETARDIILELMPDWKPQSGPRAMLNAENRPS